MRVAIYGRVSTAEQSAAMQLEELRAYCQRRQWEIAEEFIQMGEQRKYAILFAATILAARKLNEIGVKPCPARECGVADAVENAKRILDKIDERWPD